MITTPCHAPGCGVATSGAYCRRHGRVRVRVSPSRRGYGKAHARWRRLVLAADPVCHWPCVGESSLSTNATITRCLAPATIADHIKPRVDFPELAYDPDNGQGLCAAHHNAKTAEEKAGIYRRTR